MQTKNTDSKGRITLGEAFANRVMIVEVQGPEVRLRLARVIPEREAWLYENTEALGSVRRGLAQARALKLSDGPDMDEASALADSIDED